jgi:hypothetical protein
VLLFRNYIFENILMRLKTMRGALPGLGLCAVLLCGAAQAEAGSASCAAYAQDLAAMAGADAALRARQDLLAPPDAPAQGRRRDQLALVERSNGARLKALLADCGWPRRGVHGEQAGKDAWRLVRQAGEDLALQKAVAQHLEQAVLRGEAPGRELAQLDDRIAVAEGRPQRYGTRMRQVDACHWVPYPMDDRARVAERRAQVGLPTLEQQESMANSMVIHENCPAPNNPLVSLPI